MFRATRDYICRALGIPIGKLPITESEVLGEITRQAKIGRGLAEELAEQAYKSILIGAQELARREQCVYAVKFTFGGCAGYNRDMRTKVREILHRKLFEQGLHPKFYIDNLSKEEMVQISW